MRYVSTRGEAPPLGFMDVTLAGLARDGGLYVPETWPRLSPETIAGFAGRPYAEVAVEVIRPFVGDTISEAELSRLAREAYGTFRHPAVVPVAQFGASTFLLELFHGPTLAFKDVAMQLLARLMDHALAARGERTTIVVATSGDTGGAAVEAFRGRERADLFVLFPDGRISEVQRRMMTTAADDNVHAIAIEGTFDDCQALVKGLFNHHAFRDRVRLSGVNSINWARIVAQVVYYFTAAATLGAPHRKVAFTVPTGNFGDIFAGYVAAAHGPADRSPGDRHQRQRHPGAHARDRHLRGARGGGDLVALDGHPGVVEFRAPAVRGRRPRRPAGARADGHPRAVAGGSRCRPARCRRFARCFPPTAPTRRRPPRPSAPRCARPRAWSIRTPRSASRWPRRRRAIRRCR